MDKVQDFLKKHVQWIALGIGGLIFMWALWTYVIDAKSITAEVNGVEYGPGQIDGRINETSADELKGLVEGPKPNLPPQVQNIDLNSLFVNRLSPNDAPAELTVAVLPPPSDRLAQLTDDGFEGPGTVIEELPEVAPVVIVDAESGRQTVAVPVPDTEDETRTENLGSVIVRYVVPVDELNTYFGLVGLPERASLTSILDVKLMRERRLADNSWGERTEVPLLRNATYDRMPGEDATFEEKKEYAEWAKEDENAGLIVQPPFYPLDFGDEPATLALGGDEDDDDMDEAEEEDGPVFVNGIRQGFDPYDRDTWPKNLSDLTPEERKAIREARKNPNGGGQGGEFGPGGYPGGGYPGGGFPGGGYPGGGFPGGPGGPGASLGGGDGNIYASFQGGRGDQDDDQSDQGGVPPGYPGGFPGYPGGGFPGYPGGEFGGYPGGGFPGFPGGPQNDDQPDRRSVGTVPGEFAPADYGDEIEGWAFDETVVPGETYRYNVVYSIRNPAFNTQNIVEDEAMTQQLALTSDMNEEWESRWSDSVRVKRMSDWFMKSVLPGRDQRVQFDVFRWQDGQWQKQTFAVGPGDLLGGERGGVDYVTDRVLVDVRTIIEGGREETVAVLMDQTGRFTLHDSTEDDSAAYEELDDEVNDAVAGR